MRITEKKLSQLIREELDAHTPRDPDLAAVKSVLDRVDLDLPDEVVRAALPDIRAALGGEAPADAHFARVFDAIAAAGLMDWRSGDELNERRVDPAGDAARTLATGLTTAEGALAALERRAARVEGLDTAALGELRDHLTGARGALEALGLLSKRG